MFSPGCTSEWPVECDLNFSNRAGPRTDFDRGGRLCLVLWFRSRTGAKVVGSAVSLLIRIETSVVISSAADELFPPAASSKSLASCAVSPGFGTRSHRHTGQVTWCSSHASIHSAWKT
ncbi:hypothetical protein HanRHA438_Chr09g0397561 [Helianthus annuus]|nr:hypothetical protein HanRHA438_Chr09g0397561 [Helianthus annuus]